MTKSNLAQDLMANQPLTPEQLAEIARKVKKREPMTLGEYAERMDQFKNRFRHRAGESVDEAPVPVYRPVPKPHPVEKSYVEWKRLLFKRWQEVLDKRLAVDEENIPVVNGLLKWFIGDPTGPLPLNKGIYLYGLPGNGKTKLFKGLRKLSYERDAICRGLWGVSYKAIKKKGIRALDSYRDNDLYIDDLGYREQQGKTMSTVRGESVCMVEEIVYERCARYSDHGIITCMTGNKTIEEISLLYGDETSTRIEEMCTYVHLRGTSKRG